MDYNTWCGAFRTEPFLKLYHEKKTRPENAATCKRFPS